MPEKFQAAAAALLAVWACSKCSQGCVFRWYFCHKFALWLNHQRWWIVWRYCCLGSTFCTEPRLLLLHIFPDPIHTPCPNASQWCILISPLEPLNRRIENKSSYCLLPLENWLWRVLDVIAMLVRLLGSITENPMQILWSLNGVWW